MLVFHAAVYTIVAIVLLTSGGNWVCRKLFVFAKLKDANTETDKTILPAGWIIGALERLILAIGILTHSWEVLVAVVALKTVARFKELDDQKFAEYFLVGSLFSVLWAIFITSAWLGYDNYYGVDLHAIFSQIIDNATP